MVIKRGAPEYQGQAFYCNVGEHLFKVGNHIEDNPLRRVTCAACTLRLAVDEDFLFELGMIGEDE